jgi:5-enolpyruvylshikimate-3-phosphate synthase
MKLANRFKEEDKIRVWVDHQFCVLCGSNQNCSLHHIDGTTSSSIYNSAMLCYNCHKKADTHNTQSPLSKAFRGKLRNITYNLVKKSGHIDNQNDKDYNAIHQADSA